MLFTRLRLTLPSTPPDYRRRPAATPWQVRAIALKELVDNALDASANVTLERVNANT